MSLVTVTSANGKITKQVPLEVLGKFLANDWTSDYQEISEPAIEKRKPGRPSLKTSLGES